MIWSPEFKFYRRNMRKYRRQAFILRYFTLQKWLARARLRMSFWPLVRLEYFRICLQLFQSFRSAGAANIINTFVSICLWCDYHTLHGGNISKMYTYIQWSIQRNINSFFVFLIINSNLSNMSNTSSVTMNTQANTVIKTNDDNMLLRLQLLTHGV